MVKNYLLCISLLFILFACKDKELVNGIFVTGDHTTVLRVWKGESNNTFNISNFQDSSRVAYPAYWLSINEKYAAFYYQADANSNKVGYFTLAPIFKKNTRDVLELENLKLIYARDIVAGLELIGADETKSVILDGSIEKK